MVLKSSSTPSVRLTASLLPENFIQGGLPSKFEATIRRARFAPWNYMGKRDNYSLAVLIDFEPDEDSGLKPFTQFYSAGDLHRLVPTLDGKTPAGATLEEYKILAEGPDEPLSDDEFENFLGYEALPIKPDQKDQTKNEKQITHNTNIAFFIAKALDAKFPVNKVDNDIRFLEGCRGHFVRIDGPDREGLKKKGGGSENSQNDGKILVMTDFYGFENEKGGKGEVKSSMTTTTAMKKSASSSSSSTPASKRSSTPAVEDLEEEEVEEQNEETSEEVSEGGGDDFDSEVENAILNILAKNKGKIKRTALSPLVMREFSDGDSKALALTRLEAVLANGEGWTYDEETKILSLA